MTANDTLIEAFNRVQEIVHAATKGSSTDMLAYRPHDSRREGRDNNSIGWLIWHLTRVQDEHLTELIGGDSVWQAEGWQTTFGLPFSPEATGFGQAPEEAARLRIAAEPLTGYYDAVHQRTIHYIKQLSAADYDEIIDDNWDPPVSRGARLVSVLADDLQHAGQAMYVRGLLS